MERDDKVVFDKENLTLTFTWWTGGRENAVCGRRIKFKPEAIEAITDIISDYKPPHIPYDPEYKESF